MFNTIPCNPFPPSSEQAQAGGGGTSNYEDLENKPKIDSVELSGNKSLTDLGIASVQSVDELKNTLSELTLLTDTVEISFPADATYVDSTMSVAKTGKSVIGVVGFNCSNYDMIPYALKITGQNLIYGIRSRTGSALGTSSICHVTILYRNS